MVGKTNTVLGAIPAGELSFTLPHEHVFIDIGPFCRPATAELRRTSLDQITLENLSTVRLHPLSNRSNVVLDDVALATRELLRFQRAGGRSLVELTSLGIGRNPHALAEVSRLTGVQIICGSGYYMALTHPPAMGQKPVEEIAAEITNDLTIGIDGSEIRAGIIGEIGTSDPITPNEVKSLRGAAQAALQTGAPVNVHQEDTGRRGHRILDILEDAGLPPNRVILSHLDYLLYEDDYHESLAKRGAYIEYDLFGIGVMMSEWLGGIPHRSDSARIRMARRLFERGFGDRLLCSHDVCSKLQLTEYGGFGYAHLLDNLTGAFAAHGFTDGELETIFVENPARVLGWEEPRGSKTSHRERSALENRSTAGLSGESGASQTQACG